MANKWKEAYKNVIAEDIVAYIFELDIKINDEKKEFKKNNPNAKEKELNIFENRQNQKYSAIAYMKGLVKNILVMSDEEVEKYIDDIRWGRK